MSALDGTAWPKVRPHYDERIQIHRELLSLRKQGNTRQFAALLLGVSNPAGNYSADEHALGPKICRRMPTRKGASPIWQRNSLL